MDERVRFVGRLLGGEKMVALCREFAISRPSASVGCPHNRMRFPRHLRQEASAYLHSPDKLFALEDTFALRVANDRVTVVVQVALPQCSAVLIPLPLLFLRSPCFQFFQQQFQLFDLAIASPMSGRTACDAVSRSAASIVRFPHRAKRAARAAKGFLLAVW